MPGCPNIHEDHPEFKKSYDSGNPDHKKLVDKFTKFFKEDNYPIHGERLRGDLSGFKSFPKSKTPIPERIYFILCGDCNAELLSKKCIFCKVGTHTMKDAVLFYYSEDHQDKTEQKRINRLGLEYKQE